MQTGRLWRIACAVGMARDPYVMKPFEFDADAALAAILRPGRHQMGPETLLVAKSTTQMSQVSRTGQQVATLSPELRDAYEERAAIVEFDGGFERSRAEELALADILEKHPRRADS